MTHKYKSESVHDSDINKKYNFNNIRLAVITQLTSCMLQKYNQEYNTATCP